MPLHESLVTEEHIAAADNKLDADKAEAAMEETVDRRVAMSKSEAREAKRKSTRAASKNVAHPTKATES